MKKQFKGKISIIMTLTIVGVLFIATTAMGGGFSAGYDFKCVQNGHLNAFGDKVTVGEVFNVVSQHTVKWSGDALDPSDPDAKDNYLVEAGWTNQDNEAVVIQFVVAKQGDDFKLWGATLNGKFMDADKVIDGIAEAYKQMK